MIKRICKPSLLLPALIAALFLVASSFAASGDLDTTFGQGGMISSPDAFYASAIKTQSDGKIIVVSAKLRRFLANGSPDPFFGVNGAASYPAGHSTYYSSIAIQPDGKIVVGGTRLDNPIRPQFAVARFNPDGSLDASFGDGGKVFTSFGPTSDYVNAVLIQPDGKLVAIGTSGEGLSSAFAIARYNTDGSLDSQFGSGGKVRTQLTTRNDSANSAVLQSDGKIVVAGSGDNDTSLHLVRYSVNGLLDPTFGIAGKKKLNFDDERGRGGSIAIRPDGRLLVAGCVGNDRSDFTIFGLLSDGSADSEFGAGGVVKTDFGFGYQCVNDIQLQADGKVIAGGSALIRSKGSFAMAKYSADGVLDANFGTGGKVITSLSENNDVAEVVDIQPDGRILLAGYSDWVDYNDDYTNMAIVRYQNGLPGRSISGRVLNPSGSPIRNVAVSLIDSAGNQRTTTTGSFGVFTFDDLTINGEYTIVAKSKRYRFAPRLISSSENTAGIELVAAE